MQNTPPTQAEISRAVQQETDRRIGSAVVRNLCGDVSLMTIHRWATKPELRFPTPVYIGRRKYWKESEIVGWLESQPRNFAA